jgi:hypothetical protein
MGPGLEISYSAKFELSYLQGLNSGRELSKLFLTVVARAAA